VEDISRTTPDRDVFYYRQRQKNRVIEELASFFADEAERTGITKKDIADRLGKDPAQISRWLAGPSNLTLDTISDLLLVLGAEMDQRIVKFSDREIPNYEHPMIGKLTDRGLAVANISGPRQGTFGVKSVAETVTFEQPSLFIVTVTGNHKP
jgi:transcriptional regulator with XRE-family HTH domain